MHTHRVTGTRTNNAHKCINAWLPSAWQSKFRLTDVQVLYSTVMYLCVCVHTFMHECVCLCVACKCSLPPQFSACQSIYFISFICMRIFAHPYLSEAAWKHLAGAAKDGQPQYIPTLLPCINQLTNHPHPNVESCGNTMSVVKKRSCKTCRDGASAQCLLAWQSGKIFSIIQLDIPRNQRQRRGLLMCNLFSQHLATLTTTWWNIDTLFPRWLLCHYQVVASAESSIHFR